jgi:hypothetical protein
MSLWLRRIAIQFVDTAGNSRKGCGAILASLHLDFGVACVQLEVLIFYRVLPVIPTNDIAK